MTRSSIATRAPQAGQAAHRGGGDHWVEAAPFANGLYRREGNLEPESSKQALQGMRALHELLGKTRRQSHEYHKGCEEREATIKQECDNVRTSSVMYVSNVHATASALDIVSFLEARGPGSKLLACRLFARKGPQRAPFLRGRGLHVGRGEVQFALRDAVWHLLEEARTKQMQQSPHSHGVDSWGYLSISAPDSIACGGLLRMKGGGERLLRRSKIAEELFQATKLQMGNILDTAGDHRRALFELILELDIMLRLDMAGRAVALEFEQTGNFYRVELRLRYVARGALLHTDELTGLAALVIPVIAPPRIYRLDLEAQRERFPGASPQELRAGAHSKSDLEYSVDERNDFLRTTDFTPQQAFGRSFAYRMVLNVPAERLRPGGRSHHLLEQLYRCHILSESAERQWGTCRVISAPGPGHLKSLLLVGIPYMVQYWLEVLLSHGAIADSQLDVRFTQMLLPKATPEEFAVAVLEGLLASRHRVDKLAAAFLELRMHLMALATPPARVVPTYGMLVARVLVTPTRIVCLPPEVELSNRVVRHFQVWSQYFLRVSFTEENGKRLCFASDSACLDDFYARYKSELRRMSQCLHEGIDVAGRHHELLGYSSGQLREQAAWFWSAPPGGPSAAEIRAWMGSLGSIRCIAKYTARMGQCFSNTYDTLRLQDYQVGEISDMERGGQLFSDGVGRISPELAAGIAARLARVGRCPEGLVPSAFQIRYAGAKGMVTLHPGLKGKRLEVRPSMTKFASDASILEVCAHAQHAPGYLNRQFITLLMDKCLGVPDGAFRELQRDMMIQLDQMLTEPDTAWKILTTYGSGNGQVMAEAAAMISAGFSVAAEPYLKSALVCLRAHLLHALKEKTRIYVPESVLLMGVMDEAGVLAHGELFLQIAPRLGGEAMAPVVITGPVIMGKNPCFHPGDVRLLQAVDRPELHHLVNVLVFPQHGLRSHANETSGGDLDGDQFFVCWDPRLMPPREWPPMEYTSKPPLLIPDDQDVDPLKAEVTVADIGNFLMDYAKGDVLGVVANSHLAQADAHHLGARSEKCLQLAQLHSDAVDFPKTGRKVELSRDLVPKQRPDFMANKHQISYESQTIIGQLYREVEEPKPPVLSDIFELQAPELEGPDLDLTVPGYKQHILDAIEKRMLYERELMAIMNQYGVYNEAEVVSGCISKFAKHKRKKGDVKALVIHAVQGLRRHMLQGFERALPSESEERELVAAQRACAWYHVTYAQPYSNYSGPYNSQEDLNARLISFPWILTIYLAKVKSMARLRA